MDIIKIPMEDLTPDPSNAKDHPKWQIEQIKNSIEAFGNLDPIGVWGDDNIIVEGHGRFEALKQLGYQEAECIRLDWLTEEERKAYALAHNKLTMNSGFDPEKLALNLGDIEEIDMSLFGFGFDPDKVENPYTIKVDVPQYEPTGMPVGITELCDDKKSKELAEEVEKAEGLLPEEKAFLILASMRHIVFDYRNIAEYYTKASPEMQRLMEKSALVIIDFDNAIANGYVSLSDKLKKAVGGDA